MWSYDQNVEPPATHSRRLEVILILEQYVLLGRDVLNHFYARLNGPDLTFDISVSPLE